ncbi:TetR/AcrR family transcriptional regulator C-terminal domain-containing protein [Variovorax sp. OV329]|uniref:TetR/AcrR family transcriptional regulator C-terminal domain-containing protein n=1 Tax=Variovorax sp. OV329 TaxID=1882825 RepID=UPI0008F279BB|nr:TetR/AcrR family transcriptional regulator C-terminal domain-containing protein [Variovorax sp. OV329]SFN50528.1 hypothetical protein SAMN05444747_13123 [Variovorax sp. OV329]
MTTTSTCLPHAATQPPFLSHGRDGHRRCHVLDQVGRALQQATHGVTNIQAIVSGVGITRDEVLRLFGGFGELVEALVDTLARSVLSPLDDCATEEDFVRRLTAFARRFTDPAAVLQEKNLYRIALTEAIRDAGRGQGLYARGPGQVLGGLSRFLSNAQHAGVLLRGEGQQLASHLLALLKACSGLDDRFPPEPWRPFGADAGVQEVVDQFLAGVQQETRHAYAAV